MRLKIYGLGFDKSKASAAITPKDVFASLMAKPCLTKPGTIRHGISTISVSSPNNETSEDWFVGVVLRVRDSKLFTKLTERDGAQVLTSEMLGGTESLAEASFLIVNPRSGGGLFAHHYQSASLLSGFCPILVEEFRSIREARINHINQNASLSATERKMKSKELNGWLWPQQLVLPQNFKQLVASMKTVKSVRVRLASVTSGKRLFRGCSFEPEKETIEYKLPLGAVSEEIAENLQICLDDSSFSGISAIGLDKDGNERTYTNEKNPMIFDEVDYDTMMTDFELDTLNFKASLCGARIINHLVALARGSVVWELLERS